MKKYKIGIIGFGFIGKVHTFGYSNLKFYYDLPFEVELFGICASTKETLKKAENFGFKFFTQNADELIKHPEIDIVDICSPNIFHKEQLISAMNEQKHIYCEKPLVCDIKETIEIEKIFSKKYKKISQMVFHNRFFPATLKTKFLIEKGFLGKPLSFRSTYFHSGSLDKNKPIGWKQEKGAGVLLDLGSHIIDLVYWFLGEFESVIGKSTILYPERIDKNGKKIKIEVEDSISFLAKMKNGSIGSIEASKITIGSEDQLTFEIYGTEGAIKYNSMNPNFLKVFNKEEKCFKNLPTVQKYEESNFPGPKFSIGWIRAHIHSIYNFLSCIDKNVLAEPSISAGIYNMKVCDAVKNSEKTGKWEFVK